jgi:hypothetical protein
MKGALAAGNVNLCFHPAMIIAKVHRDLDKDITAILCATLASNPGQHLSGAVQVAVQIPKYVSRLSTWYQRHAFRNVVFVDRAFGKCGIRPVGNLLAKDIARQVSNLFRSIRLRPALRLQCSS